MSDPNKLDNNPDNNDNPFSILEDVPFTPEIKEEIPEAGEPWVDFPDRHEGVDENEPDIDNVAQTLWRGERVYLDNIDSVGSREVNTVGHEATHNRDGKVYTARDKYYASTYAVGKDGATFYDGPLPKEKIPIGVIYKINNSGNHLGAQPTSDPDTWKEVAGKVREREFVADNVPAEDYEVTEFYIMDDFKQPGGHTRSDARQPMEVFKVGDQSRLPEVIEKVKKRINYLDQHRA